MSAEITSVRHEDAFDIEAVNNWLASHVSGLSGSPEIKQFRSGASNLTYLLKYANRELVLRRPPIGTKAASAHDMKREFSIQKKLRQHFSLVPNVLALCEDQKIIGSDFYVMDRINGLILRRDLPEELTLSEEETKRIVACSEQSLYEQYKVPQVIGGE